MHGTAARSNILKKAWSEKKAIGTAKGAKRTNRITKNALVDAVEGAIFFFVLNLLKVVLQNVLPARVGDTILHIATKHFQSTILFF